MKMPYYDSKTDTMHNCKKYSYDWFHEDRHRKQYKIKWINKLDAYSHIFGYYASFAMIFALLLDGSVRLVPTAIGVCMLPYIMLMFCIEVDAYIVGYLNFKRFSRKF